MFWPSKKMHVLEEPVPEARMRIAPQPSAMPTSSCVQGLAQLCASRLQQSFPPKPGGRLGQCCPLTPLPVGTEIGSSE